MNATPFIDFAGRRVVVTGASSGIGRAVAVELGRRGAELILIGRRQPKLEETARMAAPAVCHPIVADLENTPSIQAIVGDCARRVGRIYGLCHSAGMVETRPLNVFKEEAFLAMMKVNLTAALELARAVSRRDVMAEEGGSILFVASIYAWVGMPGQIGYCATKGALVAAARAMAVELARRRIRVNTLSPGMVRTPMTEAAFAGLSAQQVQDLESTHPLGPGQPEDVARAAVFLLAPENRWMTGTDLVIDGGCTAR